MAFHSKSFYEFENMFGYRLRSNVADPEEVDIMIKKVYRLLNHILSVDYNIFEPNNKDNWESTLDYFYKYMETVENEASVVLDQCIDSLKSAEQGLELIAYMSKVETRQKLLKHLMNKRESIMKKFVNEVGTVEHEFLVCIDKVFIFHLYSLRENAHYRFMLIFIYFYVRTIFPFHSIAYW